MIEMLSFLYDIIPNSRIANVHVNLPKKFAKRLLTLSYEVS